MVLLGWVDRRHAMQHDPWRLCSGWFGNCSAWLSCTTLWRMYVQQHITCGAANEQCKPCNSTILAVYRPLNPGRMSACGVTSRVWPPRLCSQKQRTSWTLSRPSSGRCVTWCVYTPKIMYYIKWSLENMINPYVWGIACNMLHIAYYLHIPYKEYH